MDWSKFNKDARKHTVNQRDSQIRTLSKFLKKHNIDLAHSISNHKLTIEIINDFLQDYNKKQGYAPHTAVSYLSVISALIERFDGDPTLLKQVILRKKEFEKIALDAKTSVPPFDLKLLIPNAKSKLDSADRNSKIIIGTIIYGLAGLRLNDLIHTRLNDDGKHSWIDKDSQQWFIKAKYTKNNQDRQFDVPVQFIKHIETYARGEWLLSNKRWEKYSDTRHISNKFKKMFGFNYGRVRKGAADAIYQMKDINLITRHANMLGHHAKTELLKYVSETKPVKPVKPTRKPKIKITVKATSSDGKCKGITKKGKQCSRNATTQDGYCKTHQPH